MEGRHSPKQGRRATTGRPLIVWGWFLLAVLLTVGPVAGGPPRPGDENGLTENETATLWSGDDDSRYITNAEYEEAYGEPRTTLHEIGNATDLTFTKPPETAEVWTRAGHLQFPGSDTSTSYYPPGTNLTESQFLADAHVSVFSVSPATVAHLGPGADETVFYLAPSGEIRAVIDYRARFPELNGSERLGPRTPSTTFENTSYGSPPAGDDIDAQSEVTWRVVEDSVDEVRLRRNGFVLDRTDEQRWPVLSYSDLDGGDTTLIIEADVSIRLERTTTTVWQVELPETDGVTLDPVIEREVEEFEETVTLSETVSGRVYDLEASVAYATYPDGTIGVAVSQNGPWQGYTLTADESVGVRGVWRFYTARDQRWDTLVRSTRFRTDSVDSPAPPVAVHAYPSELGPRVEPVGRGIELLEVWGIERESPAETLGEHVHVDVVTEPYWTSYGLAVRTQRVDPEALTLHGIVRGVDVSPPISEETAMDVRRIRESKLTATVLDRDSSGITVELRLTDAKTGLPIRLGAVDDARYAPIIEDERSGYIEIGDQRVVTGDGGLALVRIEEPGIHTARYVPGSWLSHDPAYTESSATVRWHPFSTAEAILTFASEVALAVLPLGLALYAARKLGEMLRYRHGGDSE